MQAKREKLMINIHGSHSAAGTKAVESIGATGAAAPTSEPMVMNDVVEISTAAKLAAKVHDIPDVRADLVARVKSEIEAGTYETPERVDATVNKLMEELFPGY